MTAEASPATGRRLAVLLAMAMFVLVVQTSALDEDRLFGAQRVAPAVDEAGPAPGR